MSLCESILFVEQSHIEFDACVLHHQYSQDIQIWNRSECDLYFRIQLVHKVIRSNSFSLYNYETESPIIIDEINHVRGFSSLRIRITLTADTIGCFEDELIFENVYNPMNTVCVGCFTGVTESPNALTEHRVVLEIETGVYLQQGQSLTLDPCYYGQSIRKRLWVKNLTSDSISLLDVSSETCPDVSFDLGKHIPDENVRQAARERLTRLDENFKVVSEETVGESLLKKQESFVESRGGTEAHEEVESMASWANVMGNISYDPRSMWLWDSINADDDDFIESRCSLRLEKQVLESGGRGSAEDSSFIDKWRRSMAGNTSPQEFILKPNGRLPLTLTYTPICPFYQPASSYASLTTAIVIFSLQWKEMSRARSNSDGSRRHMHWWRSPIIIDPPRLHHYTFSAKTMQCLSVITVNPTHVNLGECIIGEYYTADFVVTNTSDLPALVYPHVSSETLGIVHKEVLIPPKSDKLIQVDYVARLVNYEYSRRALLYNVYHPLCSPQIEIKAKNIDPNQILSHSIFYKIFTRNKRRQLQIYYDKAFYNIPNIRVFSIKNIFHKQLRLCLQSTDRYELTLYTFGSSSHVLKHHHETIDEEIEELKWGDGVALNRRRKKSYPPFAFGRRSTSSLDLQAAEPDSPLKTHAAAQDARARIDNCIALFERPGFPFDNSILDTALEGGKDSHLDPNIQRIRKIQKSLKEFRESSLENDYLMPIDGTECVLEVGTVYDFIVVFEPRSHGKSINCIHTLVMC